MAKFAQVIECLNNGGTAHRIAWEAEGDKEIMMQIPQRIAKDIVPKMTSVQDHIKTKLLTVGSGEIEYHDQVIIITFTDDGKTPARATYYSPTWEDIFADDWQLSEDADSYKERMRAEAYELEDKLGKLASFFKSHVFETLSEEKQKLMHEQYDAMRKYLDVLSKRCALEDIVL